MTMSQDNFIGGRVPQEVKRELKARAVAGGKSMQELLEEIIFGYLDGREALNGVETDKLLSGIQTAIAEVKLPAVDSTTLKEEILEITTNKVDKVAKGLETMLKTFKESLKDRIIEQLEDRIDTVKEDLEDSISDIENNMVYASDDDDDDDEPKEDFTGFRKLMAEEINCVIVSAFEDYLEEDSFDKVEVLQKISKQFFLEAEEPRSPECRDHFRIILPDDFAEEVAKVVNLAIADMEFEDDKQDVFGKLHELFGQAAQLQLNEQNSIKLSFSETEWEAIDRLTASLAENKASIRNRQSLIKYLIGRELIREGERLFWAKDELLIEAGRGMT